MSRFAVLAFFALFLTLSCGSLGGDDSDDRARPAARPTAIPTPTVQVTNTPRPTLVRLLSLNTPVSGSRRSVPTIAPTRAPTAVPVASTAAQARNLLWGYLTQCVSFDPSKLEAVQVNKDWLVRVPLGGAQKYGAWQVGSTSGELVPYDPLAREWKAVVENECQTAALNSLLLPTPTFTPSPTFTPIPTPKPTPTPRPSPTPVLVVKSTSEAVATLWAHLVKCFPTLTTSNLESTLDPPSGQYVVKDKGTAVYGVWRVERLDGRVIADNSIARTREQTVQSGLC